MSKHLLLLLYILSPLFLFSQVDSVSKSADFNLQLYTPSALLKNRQLEVKIFNNLYTDNSSFNSMSQRVDNDRRQTYFTAFFQTLYGVGNRINIGIDAQIKSVYIDESPTSSPFKLFTSENPITALSYIGPKIKFTPIKKLQFFSIQSTLFIPVAKDQQGIESGNPYLSHNGFQWWTQLFYDQKISSKFRAFFELDAFVSIDRKFDESNHSIITPFKMFLSYFPTPKTTIYTLTEFGPSWGEGKINSYYTQVGIGGKYQIIKNLEIELLYTKFPLGKNSGAGTTFNFGIRYIK